MRVNPITIALTFLSVSQGFAAPPSVAKHYDARGRYTGRTITSGQTAKQYDAQGRYTGRVTTGISGPKQYDSKGTLVKGKNVK